MNKKGIFPIFGIIIAVAIALVILVGGGLAISNIFTSPSFVFLITGILIIVLTLIYIIPKAIEGNLTRQKIGFILMIFFLGVIFLFVSQTDLFPEGSGLGTEVYYPQYGNLKCDLGRADFLLYSQNEITDSKSITCGVGMNGYTDLCRFELRINQDSWLANSGLCFSSAVDSVQKCNNNGDCEDITALLTTTEFDEYYSVRLDENQDGYINTQDSNVYSTFKFTPHRGLFCKYSVDAQVTGNAYFLNDIQGNGYSTTYPQGCNLLNVNQNAHLTSQPSSFNYQQSKNQVPFGFTLNYVWGLTKGITSNVIQHKGQQVYIEKAGFYSPIKTISDGYSYVDWHTQIPDASIECVPSNLFICNSDATLRDNPSQDIEGQDCSLVRGVNPNDFFRISETECARFNCVDDKIRLGEKEQCAECGEGYIYNPQDNKCKKVGDTGTVEQQQCNAKAESNPLFGYEWVEVTKEPSIWKKIITLGQAKSTTTGYCKATFLIYYVFILISLIFMAMIFLLLKPKKKRK